MPDVPHDPTAAPAPGAAPCASACPLADAPASGVDRRAFLTRSLLAAAAAALSADVLAACAGGGGTAVTGPVASGTTLRVADYPALASVGGIATTTAGGQPIAIVRTAASTYVVLSRVCPHEQATVNANGAGFLCPLHGARFDANGTWTGGQRTSSLRSYPTTYDAAAGTLTVG